MNAISSYRTMRGSHRRNFDLLDKDDREERKYLAEEKEVTEVEMKSVSERKKEIESRLSEESDVKKKDPAAVKKTDKNDKMPDLYDDVSSKTNFKEAKSIFEKDVKEKSKSPEPAELSFSEKRLSFELGHHIAEKKLDMTQKFLDSEKMVYKMISDPDPEPELSFQEKLLSFEKGTNKSVSSETKSSICPPEEIESAKKELSTEFEKKESIETIEEFKQFDDDTKKVDEFKLKEMIVTEAQVLKSPVMSATPPPSPADVLKTKGGEDWKSQSTSDTDGEKIKNVAQKLDETFTFENLSVLPEIQKPQQICFDQFNIDTLSKAGNTMPVNEANVAVKKSTNPFESETNSPTIFRSHRAADCVIFDDEDWDTQDIVDFSTGNEQVLDVITTDKHIDNLNQTKTDSKTIFPPFQVYNFPEEQFQQFEGNIFPLNNLSYSQQESLKGSFDSNKMDGISVEKYPRDLNIGEPIKCVIDFQSSETENESPPNRNLLAEDPRSLVDIVEVTEDSNTIYFQPDIIPISSQNIKVFEKPENQINILDDSFSSSSDIKPDNRDNNFPPNMSDTKSEGQNKDFFNLDQQNNLNQDMVLVDLDYELVHKTDIKSVSLPIMGSNGNESSNASIVVPMGSGGEKFSGVEDLSKIEDELSFLEKLEDQIKLLKEEEAKMKDIKAELGKGSLSKSKTSDHFKESQSSEYLEKDINELESAKEDSFVETTFDDDFENNLAESSRNTLELSREVPVIKEESNKKKRNKKKKSKKIKDEDFKEPTSSESMDTASHTSRIGQCESDDIPEREFQKMVSQLSIEEVDEALKMWNKDVSIIAKQPVTFESVTVLSEIQKDEQISFDQLNDDTVCETGNTFSNNEANVDVEKMSNAFETVTCSPSISNSHLGADCDIFDDDDYLHTEDIIEYSSSNDQVLDVITTNESIDKLNQTKIDSKTIFPSFQEPIFSEELFQPVDEIFPLNNLSYPSQESLKSSNHSNMINGTSTEKLPIVFNVDEPLKCVIDLQNSETGNESPPNESPPNQILLTEVPRNPIKFVEVIQQSNSIYYPLDITPISSQHMNEGKESENQIKTLNGSFMPLSNIKPDILDNNLMSDGQNKDFFTLGQQNKFEHDMVLVDLDYELVHKTDIKSVSMPIMGSKENESSNLSIVVPRGGREIFSEVKDLSKFEKEFLGNLEDQIKLLNEDETKIKDIKAEIGKGSLCKSETILDHFKEILSCEYLENSNNNKLESVKEDNFLETTSDDEFNDNLTEDLQNFSQNTIELSREESIIMDIMESKKFKEEDFKEPTSIESMDFASRASTIDECENEDISERELQKMISQQSFEEVDEAFEDDSIMAKEQEKEEEIQSSSKSDKKSTSSDGK